MIQSVGFSVWDYEPTMIIKFVPRVQCHCVLLEINGERLTTCIVYVDKWVCLTLVHTYSQSLWVYWRWQRPWKNEWKIGSEAWASLSQQRCQKRGRLTGYTVSPRIAHIFVQKIHRAIRETALFESILGCESKFALLRGIALFYL